MTFDGLRFSKYGRTGRPLALEREDRKAKAATDDQKAKEAVRTRDRCACRVCARTTREVNEVRMKSRGGKASLENSITMCSKCHGYFHAHLVRVIGADCSLPLIFEMSAEIAGKIFATRSRPLNIRLV